jgi:hypothetical protein
MSGPYRTLQKFLVLKMMEQNSMTSGKAVQQEIIDNALATSKAIHEMERMNREMFNWNNPQQKQQQQNQQSQNYTNPQQPSINMQNFQTPPVSPSLENMRINDMTGDQLQNSQKAFSDMTQHQEKLRLYNQTVMEINRMLMQMQQEFFQNVQKIQQQLSEIMHSIFK